MKLPANWPKHCTPFDDQAPATFNAADWTIKEGRFEGDEVDFLVHKPSGFRFLICTKPWEGGSWKLATSALTPAVGKKA